ncbi:DUF4416 [Desulfonema limicola]|uniref:DUF4416 n=1 Tax=Desulfonema limicola TaxID=45656 RepID=A0A975GH68_9BACT|nr:DUF4416 family protein [Desulfonema limicola]QTA80969.1 DUF4416 [Desulfonema limicola]
MSIPQPPKPAKLVISIFLKDKDLINSLTEELSEKFGNIDIISDWMPFDYTSYYEPEMGSPLFRRMLSFANLIEQTGLSHIKLETNKLELKLSECEKRRVNIDPGYLLLERFVLATGKNFTHRIYIGNKIYADLTLIYTKGDFKTLPWTYPDYADKPVITFLNKVRNQYINDLKAG